MKKALLFILTLTFFSILAACSSTSNSSTGESTADAETKTASGEKEGGTLTIAWLPNESGEDVKSAREEIGKEIEKVTGKKVEHQTTTDYIIAIEAIANGNADVAFLGAQGYIEANNKNKNVQPLVVPSGKSGTLEDAVYHSWLAVKKDNEDEYKDGESFALDNIVDKKFSFVSNSSTSGFKVPSDGIVSYFNKMDKYKDLTPEDLLEGGNFFSEVLYGGSHQGSAVNLLTDKADIAAFCDTCVNNYVELADGEHNKTGAVYKVKEDAAEPFNTVPGEEFKVISVTPVLNAPFAVNMDNVSEEDRDALVKVLTSDEVANNEKVFVPEDSEESGLFAKSEDERFVEVDDAWFNPIRELSK